VIIFSSSDCTDEATMSLFLARILDVAQLLNKTAWEHHHSKCKQMPKYNRQSQISYTMATQVQKNALWVYHSLHIHQYCWFQPTLQVDTPHTTMLKSTLYAHLSNRLRGFYVLDQTKPQPVGPKFTRATPNKALNPIISLGSYQIPINVWDSFTLNISSISITNWLERCSVFCKQSPVKQHILHGFWPKPPSAELFPWISKKSRRTQRFLPYTYFYCEITLYFTVILCPMQRTLCKCAYVI